MLQNTITWRLSFGRGASRSAYCHIIKMSFSKAILEQFRYEFIKETWQDLQKAVDLYQGLKTFFHEVKLDAGFVIKYAGVTGTIPIYHKRHGYNIPVKIMLLKSYPRRAPKVHEHAKLNTPVTFRVSQNVNKEGFTDLDYLRNWKYPDNSNLISLIQEMIHLFSERPPFFPEGLDLSIPCQPRVLRRSCREFAWHRNYWVQLRE